MSANEFEMEMLGFGCASCAYTIEKLGRKIDDVDSIHVSLGDQRITVTHHGNRQAIAERISQIVNNIGHDVRLID